MDKSPTVTPKDWGYQQKLQIPKLGYMGKSFRESERLMTSVPMGRVQNSLFTATLR